MTNAMKVLVVGGGIAGTVTAIALDKAGLSPVVYEAYERAADGAGAFLTVAVNGLAALRALDIDPQDLLAAGYPTPTLVMSDGVERWQVDLPLGGTASEGIVTRTIRRADLYSALRDEAVRRGIPIAYGKRLVAVEHASGGIVASFADGDRVAGDLVVGADGLHSRTRRCLDPNAPVPRYLGLLNTGGFARRPVRGVDSAPGTVRMAFGRRCFFGWSTAPDGSVWWFANPPQRTELRRDVLAGWTPEAWRAHLLALFADDTIPARPIIEATEEILLPWNTYDLPKVPVWQDGRVVLVGDAAHAASPSSGQGASLAIEDAVTLGKCLRDLPAPAALDAYERLRRSRVQRIVQQGRRNGSPKAAGRVGRWVRDLVAPIVMRRMTRHGDPQAWIHDHRIDWAAPVAA